MSTESDLREFSVKQRTLQGLKIIGQMAVAIVGVSSDLRNLQYLSFSVEEPGFVSRLKIGCSYTLLKPQWNSIICFDGIASLFSFVLLILKCKVESLHSCGNKVDRIKA